MIKRVKTNNPKIGAKVLVKINATKTHYEIIDHEQFLCVEPIGYLELTDLIPLATEGSDGLLSASDKAKLDKVERLSEDYIDIKIEQKIGDIDAIASQLAPLYPKLVAEERERAERAEESINISLKNKVDKVSLLDNTKYAYVTINGLQQVLQVSDGQIAGSIVVRDSKGRISISEPKDDSDIATKKYVDEHSGGGGLGDIYSDIVLSEQIEGITDIVVREYGNG